MIGYWPGRAVWGRHGNQKHTSSSSVGVWRWVWRRLIQLWAGPACAYESGAPHTAGLLSVDIRLCHVLDLVDLALLSLNHFLQGGHGVVHKLLVLREYLGSLQSLPESSNKFRLETCS